MRSQGRDSGVAHAISISPWRVRAVIPCFNRRRDAELLLADLAGLDLGGRASISVVLVDCASDEPLEGLSVPPGLSVEHLRLEANAGGSGGFNAGMARVLSRGVPGDRTELIWILDSDVRLEASSLRPLLAVFESREDVAAAGSALVDPATGKVFECGGGVDPGNGEYVQPLESGWERRADIPAQYLAACSMLVRRDAVERTGLMADLFVNGDDVEWCLRMSRRTGGRLVGVPASRARHPNPDKMRTWARYYGARNAFTAMAAAGCGGLARFRRAMRETGRAVGQAMLGRDDLAELHLRGLADARAGVRGKAPGGTIALEGWTKLDGLPAALRRMLAEGTPRGRVVVRPNLLPDQLATEKALNAACVATIVEDGPDRGPVRGVLSALRSLVLGPPWGVAVVSARGRPGDWLAGRVIVSVAPEGFVIRRVRPWERAGKIVRIAARGTWSAVQLARRGGARNPVGGPALVQGVGPSGQTRRPTVGAVVLSFNRWPALEQTLRSLLSDAGLAGAPVIVADNGSTDGTLDRLKSEFPRVQVLALAENQGVAAFNRAVELAGTETVLILDDDARPEPGAIGASLDLLSRRPDLGAVALHPRHPGTKASEWAFGEGLSPRDDWPVMGCGNLVRRHAWDRVGGYEESFFLYRNDTDLAMKLLEAGFGVHFDPAWIVWHDSPAAANKSARWLDLATRNWVWLCRRHGRGVSGFVAAVAGWLWAHKLAGPDAKRQWSALKGFVRGWLRSPAPLPGGLLLDGSTVGRLLRLRLGR